MIFEEFSGWAHDPVYHLPDLIFYRIPDSIFITYPIVTFQFRILSPMVIKIVSPTNHMYNLHSYVLHFTLRNIDRLLPSTSSTDR